MFVLLFTVSLLLGTHLTIAAPTRIDDEGLTVYTANGPITGHYAANASSVIEFLGIPYAKPPVGQLRWAAPEKYLISQHYEAKDWVRQSWKGDCSCS